MENVVVGLGSKTIHQDLSVGPKDQDFRQGVLRWSPGAYKAFPDGAEELGQKNKDWNKRARVI